MEATRTSPRTATAAEVDIDPVVDDGPGYWVDDRQLEAYGFQRFMYDHVSLDVAPDGDMGSGSDPQKTLRRIVLGYAYTEMLRDEGCVTSDAEIQAIEADEDGDTEITKQLKKALRSDTTGSLRISLHPQQFLKQKINLHADNNTTAAAPDAVDAASAETETEAETEAEADLPELPVVVVTFPELKRYAPSTVFPRVIDNAVCYGIPGLPQRGTRHGWVLRGAHCMHVPFRLDTSNTTDGDGDNTESSEAPSLLPPAAAVDFSRDPQALGKALNDLAAEMHAKIRDLCGEQISDVLSGLPQDADVMHAIPPPETILAFLNRRMMGSSVDDVTRGLSALYAEYEQRKTRMIESVHWHRSIELRTFFVVVDIQLTKWDIWNDLARTQSQDTFHQQQQQQQQHHGDNDTSAACLAPLRLEMPSVDPRIHKLLMGCKVTDESVVETFYRQYMPMMSREHRGLYGDGAQNQDTSLVAHTFVVSPQVPVSEPVTTFSFSTQYPMANGGIASVDGRLAWFRLAELYGMAVVDGDTSRATAETTTTTTTTANNGPIPSDMNEKNAEHKVNQKLREAALQRMARIGETTVKQRLDSSSNPKNSLITATAQLNYPGKRHPTLLTTACSAMPFCHSVPLSMSLMFNHTVIPEFAAKQAAEKRMIQEALERMELTAEELSRLSEAELKELEKDKATLTARLREECQATPGSSGVDIYKRQQIIVDINGVVVTVLTQHDALVCRQLGLSSC